MKWKQIEYESLLSIVVENGKSIQDFSFSKKRGLVPIKEVSTNRTFRFYRKTQTSLTAEKQWYTWDTYFLSLSGNGETGVDWEEVLATFAKWLQEG